MSEADINAEAIPDPLGASHERDLARSLSASSASERSSWLTARRRLVPIALWNYRPLVKVLVETQLTLRYRGSVVGFLLSLANPLAIIAVYTFAFRSLLGVAGSGFPLRLLVGFFPFTFFTAALVAASGSLVDNGHLVRKVRFPFEALPLASVLVQLVHLGLACLVLTPVAVFLLKAPVGWPVLTLAPVIVFHVALTFGLGMLAAAATVVLRDVRHIVEASVIPLFWLTPLAWPPAAVSNHWGWLLYLNPLTPFILSYQRAICDGQPVTILALAIGATWSIAAVLAGYAAMGAVRDRVAEEV